MWLINKEAILFCWLNNKAITDDSIVGVYDKDKNICNMEDITIKQYDNGCFEVFQGNKSSDELSFDEMLGLIAALTIPESCLSLLWMKTKEQREAQKSLSHR